MKLHRKLFLLTLLLAGTISLAGIGACSPEEVEPQTQEPKPAKPQSDAPKTFLWNGEHLAAVRKAIAQKDPKYTSAYTSLLGSADKALSMKNPSVMDKSFTPASGNKHDYMSLSRYYWPNPNTPDGLPYVNRDGQSNPELEKYDRNRLGDMAGAVTKLSLAYYLSAKKEYAEKAVSLLRTWFIDPATSMNPNMNYAQIVPGLYNGMGRQYGIIDGYSFVEMLDGVNLLMAEKAIPDEDIAALRRWFANYTSWFLNSSHGKGESNTTNNHSIAYDVQLLMYSLFGGELAIAYRVIDQFPARRLQAQIKPDGSQPEELTRTRSYWYSIYNLAHMFDICDMARSQNREIYKSQGANGSGSMDKALAYLTPYIGKSWGWPYQELEWKGAEQLVIRTCFRASKYNSAGGWLDLYNKHATAAGTDGMFVLLNM
jgi:hypothetical protein